MTSNPTVSVWYHLDAASNVAVVEFSRPPANYFDVELITAIADIYAELDANPQCRAMVLASIGKHFCAGADFSQGQLSEEKSKRLYAQAARLFSYGVPVVAAVQGRAIGGGLGVAMSADFRVASASSHFVCNFSQLGTHHGFGLSVTLPAVIGQQRTLELLYTGADVLGTTAFEIGLCDRLVADDDAIRDEAIAFAERIASSSPLAVRAIRRTMWASKYPDLIQQATDLERQEQAVLFSTDDFQEGVRAAAARRRPIFVGK